MYIEVRHPSENNNKQLGTKIWQCEIKLQDEVECSNWW